MKNRRAQMERELQDSYIEDLAFWIGDLCDCPEMEPSNFWSMLDDGRLLGKVASEICDAEIRHLTDIGNCL